MSWIMDAQIRCTLVQVNLGNLEEPRAFSALVVFPHGGLLETQSH
jgi:hypothetical protein